MAHVTEAPSLQLSDASVAELVKQLSEQTSRLARQEVARSDRGRAGAHQFAAFEMLFCAGSRYSARSGTLGLRPAMLTRCC
jgi:hypothetical protein